MRKPAAVVLAVLAALVLTACDPGPGVVRDRNHKYIYLTGDNGERGYVTARPWRWEACQPGARWPDCKAEGS